MAEPTFHNPLLICPRCGRPRHSHAERCPYNEFIAPTATEEELEQRRTGAEKVSDGWARKFPSLQVKKTATDMQVYASKEDIAAVTRKDVFNTMIGRLTYRLRGAEWEIVMIESRILDVKGTGTAIVAKFLMDHPEVERIRAFLAFDNSAAYCKARVDGMTHTEALASTPLAAILVKFGFTNIISFNEPADPEYAELIPFLVERPQKEKL